MSTLHPGPAVNASENPGVPLSRLRLPDSDPGCETLVEYLARRFPHVGRARWESRVKRGRVSFAGGAPVGLATPYRPGEIVLYHREVEDEPPPAETEIIVFQDDRILIADKPHGMPVTPAGDYLERTLLVRLQRATGNRELAPAHRLDRDTAGLVLFVCDPALRGAYHQLFAEGRVEREYLAVARCAADPEPRAWRVENRIGSGDPWFRQRVVPGPPNAATRIERIGHCGSAGLFRIRPETGKKHQIRVHMAESGLPILGDRLYPVQVAGNDGDPPLQLLAARLAFGDPVSGSVRSFASKRALAMAPRKLSPDLRAP